MPADAGVEQVNVLLVGQVGAGKSSFFNSVESVFEGHVTGKANAGNRDETLTTEVMYWILLHFLVPEVLCEKRGG